MGWWVVLGVVGVAEATAAVKWVVPSPPAQGHPFLPWIHSRGVLLFIAFFLCF